MKYQVETARLWLIQQAEKVRDFVIDKLRYAGFDF